MGEPIPPEIEYGANCITCWPAGKTPKFLMCIFAGIEDCKNFGPLFPGPPNGTFILEQNGACDWIYGDDTYNIGYTAAGVSPGVLAHTATRIWFWGPGSACQKYFTNAYTTCFFPRDAGKNGTCFIGG